MRTSNKQTFTLPTNNKIDYKQQIQYNWKGLIDNKNVLATDQESFEDCCNVYVDNENILRSRPAIKQHKIEDIEHIVDAKNIFVFNNVLIYHLTNDTLKIVDENNIVNANITSKFNVIEADECIFIFKENGLDYYDLNTKIYYTSDSIIETDNYKHYDIRDKLYIPITTIHESDEDKTLESENELLTDKIEVSHIHNVDTGRFINYNNKDVKIKYNNIEENINFKRGNENVFYDTGFIIPNEAVLNERPTGNNWHFGDFAGKIHISVSVNNTFLLAVHSGGVSPTSDVWQLYYSKDGISLKYLDIINANDTGLPIYTIPKISKDGSVIYYLSKDGVYAKYVDGSTDWINLFVKHNLEGSYYFEFGYVQYMTCNIDMIDIYNFVFVWIRKFAEAFIVCDGKRCYPDLPYLYYDFVDSYNFKHDIVAIPNHTTNEGYYDGSFSYSHHIAVDMNKYNDNTRIAIVVTQGDVRWDNDTASKYIGGGGNTYLIVLSNSYKEDSNGSFYVSYPLNMHSLVAKSKALSYNTALKTGVRLIKDRVYFITYDNGFDYTHTDYDTQYFASIPADICVYHGHGQYDDEDIAKNISILYTEQINATDISGKPDISIDEYGNYNTNTKYIYNNVKLNLLTSFSDYMPLNNNTYYAKYDDEYRLLFKYNGIVQVFEQIEGEYNNLVFDNFMLNSEYYASINKKLYISNTGAEAETFKWYFPKQRTQEFETRINNLHAISDGITGVFTNDGIYYANKDSNELLGTVFTYIKSKINLPVLENSDILTTFDGSAILYPTKNGLVGMQYKDFIASTDQTLNYLSVNIQKIFDEYCKSYVKLLLYKNWLLCYNNTSDLFVLDMRTATWWPMKSFANIDKIVEYDNKLLILIDGKSYYLDESINDYKDNADIHIDWNFKSQRLHFSAINYYKAVSQILLVTANDYEIINEDNAMQAVLKLKSYRKFSMRNIEDDREYDINVLKNFVKRCNLKCSEFQYEMSNSKEQYVQIPIKLSTIGIKYRLTGAVR